MTRHVPISEFKDHASELVAAVQNGDEIIITRHGKAAAMLIAPPEAEGDRRKRALAALTKLAEIRDDLRSRGMTATVEEIIEWKNGGRP